MAFIEELLGYDPDTGQSVRNNYTTVETVLDAFAEPLTVDELKGHLKVPDFVSDADEDSFIALVGKAARVRVEELASVATMQQTKKLTLDVADRTIDLLITPVISISSVEVILGDDVDTLVAVSSSLYTNTKRFLRARSSWPSHRGFQSFVITYKVGYGENDGTVSAAENARALVPANLKLAITQLAGHWLENREGQGPDSKYYGSLAQTGHVPESVYELLRNYIIS